MRLDSSILHCHRKHFSLKMVDKISKNLTSSEKREPHSFRASYKLKGFIDHQDREKDREV